MRVFHLVGLFRVEVGGPETDDDVDQENKVDACINESDCRSIDLSVALIVIENLQRNQDRVVQRQYDDRVIPVLYERPASSK